MNRLWVILIFSILVSCVESTQTRTATTGSSNVTGGTGGTDSGNNLTGEDDGIDGDEDAVIAKVELRHLIEPKIEDDDGGGSYKRKLTLPKNYNGLLYLAGINISSLHSERIVARFKFGLDKSAIEVETTVSTAPGLTPQTKIEVLVLDLRSKPFDDIQLIYDLYDYNSYDFTGATSGALSEPVSSNRDDNLYCRGLELSDDPTFTGSIADACSDSNDICKYAYVKVVDKGLVESGSPNIPYIPSEINVQSGNVSYYDDEDSIKVDRCLPDELQASYTYDLSTSLTFNDSTATTIDGVDYFYMGPYRSINTDNWHMSSDALTGEYGVFGSIFSNDLQFGYNSKLFPRYTQFNLIKNTEYLGASIADDTKALLSMSANGTSTYLDGCNERVRTIDDITGEHIGSCNVTATIEIVAIADDGTETVVDITDEVKLQLVKPEQLNSSNENVLLSSFQQCSSSNQCGSDSCCINKRCWSKTLVSQCVEDLPNYGNLITGETCGSDYECSSLCCDKISGTCQPHDTIATTPVYCAKSSGQSCVAKEWCQKHPVTTCGIIKTGTDPFGNVTCALRCITAEVFGECVASDGIGAAICTPPEQPDSPTFDPTDPDRCNPDGGLLTLAQLIEIANNPGQGNPQTN